MNDEDAFWATLDANPDDHVTRVVFADWLQERGDLRAEGYRALGVLRLQPCHLEAECFTPEHPAVRTSEYLGKFWWCNADDARYERYRLPKDWYQAWGQKYTTRREAEDAAALAFANLPPERRTVLLAGKLTECQPAKAKKKPKRQSEAKKPATLPKGKKS